MKGHRGIGKSGLISIDSGKQEILERSAVSIDAQGVEIRFTVGLPAEGRRILGKEAMAIFFQEIPQIGEQCLLSQHYDPSEVKLHVEVAEDQEAIQKQLDEKGLVAFVHDMSILPRRSGVDDQPLTQNVAPFYYPPELEVEMSVPNRGRIKGMGIPKGVTLIVGGGFHGKTTLLNAIERGSILTFLGMEGNMSSPFHRLSRCEQRTGGALRRWISVLSSATFPRERIR